MERLSVFYRFSMFGMVISMIYMLFSSVDMFFKDYHRELTFEPHSIYKTGVFLGDENQYYIQATPNTGRKYVEAVKLLGESNERKVSIPYYGVMSDGFWKEIEEGFFQAFVFCHASYPEYFSNKQSFGIQRLRLTNEEYLISISVYHQEVKDYTELQALEEAFRDGVQGHLLKMEEMGRLPEDGKEIVAEVFAYVTEVVEYRLEEDDPFTYSGYSVVERGWGVCQGYVAMFHGMLQTLGFETMGITGEVKVNGESHVWSKVLIDGEVFYFDPTFGDGAGGVNMSWAFLTEEEINQDRVPYELEIVPLLDFSW